MISALALACFLLLLASPAGAQDSDAPVVFSADQIGNDAESGELVARGHVVMLHRGFLLEADELRYDETSGRAVASGNVRITDPEGAVLRATRIELENELRAGAIENVHVILDNGARLAAARGERFPEGTSRLDRAVFSPCPVCQDDPDDVPIWQLRAVRVTHDREARRLIYRDAFFDVFGVPVMWTPWFSHPDPTAERATGLLVPDIRTTKELGLVLELPVLWTLSPSFDVTLTPIVTTEAPPALAGKLRRHVGKGRFEVQGAFTINDQPGSTFDDNTNDGLRGFISATGRYLHDENWQSTVQGQFATDDTFMRIYNFSNADTLVSSYKLEGFFDRSYVRGEALGFQGLRVEDVDGLTAHALPLIDANFVSSPGVFGGTVSARLNTLQLIRTNGADTKRLSGSVQWEAPFILPTGQRIVFDAFLRGDVYDIRDADNFDTEIFAVDGGTEVRGMARASATMTWPFISHAGGVTQVIEPVVQVMAVPEGSNNRNIPNEDSRTFELSAANLFSLNRAPGLDVWESGSRATWGLKYRLDSRDIAVAAMAGQSYRVNDQGDFFPDGTGVADKLSDVIGAVDISWRDWFSISWQGQFDKDEFTSRRQEFVATFGVDRINFNVGYLDIDRGLPLSGRESREEIRFDANLRATDTWNLFGGLVYELQDRDDPIEWETGVLYKDSCCLEIGVSVRKRFTLDRDVEPGTAVIFRIRLRDLG